MRQLLPTYFELAAAWDSLSAIGLCPACMCEESRTGPSVNITHLCYAQQLICNVLKPCNVQWGTPHTHHCSHDAMTRLVHRMHADNNKRLRCNNGTHSKLNCAWRPHVCVREHTQHTQAAVRAARCASYLCMANGVPGRTGQMVLTFLRLNTHMRGCKPVPPNNTQRARLALMCNAKLNGVNSALVQHHSPALLCDATLELAI